MISIMCWRLLIMLVTLMLFSGTSKGAEPPMRGPIQICPVQAGESVPPIAYDRPDCWTSNLYGIDIQSRALWLRIQLSPLPKPRPFLGLLVSMKAASEVFLGREKIGHNGLPGTDNNNELPGQMDWVLPMDETRLADEDYVVDLRLSSFQNWLELRHPIHGLQLVDYPNQQDRTLRYYLPTLLPMGVFLLAIFYFGSLTWQSEDRVLPALLTALAALVTMQLFFEASRGLFAYSYPVQDLRLIGIQACSVGFGLGLVAVIARRFWPERLWLALLVTTIGLFTVPLFTSSMDARTALSLLTGSAIALILALIGWHRKMRGAAAYASALLAFLALNMANPSSFIDHGFYLLVAVFLVILMVLQAMAYSRERQGRLEQHLRADQLQRALDQAQANRQPQVLSIPGTGSVQSVQVNDVVRIQGAGDYAELHLSDGREVLHNATLNELDSELPTNFLRVHRSHLVNTRYIERLDRNEGGTGTLHLQGGQTIPVSRRIMPGVRRALR